MTTKNWRPVTNADDWMRSQEKRLTHEERRPVIGKASDLLGPGFDAHAVRLDDWNSPQARFNGFWYTEDARHGPVESGICLGLTIATLTHITQIALTHTADTEVWTRQVHAHTTVPVFDPWQQTNPRPVPVGVTALVPSGMPVPEGWLPCDGRLYPLTQYPDLGLYLPQQPTPGAPGAMVFQVPNLTAQPGMRWIIRT